MAGRVDDVDMVVAPRGGVLARMVIPRSRSSALESITRSGGAARSPSVPDCCNSLSTSVVLPWSTWAIIAMLRSCAITMLSVWFSAGGGHYSEAHQRRSPARGGLRLEESGGERYFPPRISLTIVVCGPLTALTSNSTFWFSASVRNPFALDDRVVNEHVAAAILGAMKPKPWLRQTISQYRYSLNTKPQSQIFSLPDRLGYRILSGWRGRIQGPT